MGRGAAQLGKAVKGKSKERKKEKKSKLKGDTNGDKQITEDIKMLEEYEKLNKLAEAQRNRLKVSEGEERKRETYRSLDGANDYRSHSYELYTIRRLLLMHYHLLISSFD